MSWWLKLLRVILFLTVAGLVAFAAHLYNFCEKQKRQIEDINKQQEAALADSSSRFKYQQDQIGRLKGDLQTAREEITQQKMAIEDQKDALAQEAHKREQIEGNNKEIQTTLVDIKAETDAIKEQMRGWQKDYVAVLAQLEKKMEDSQVEIKAFEDNLRDLNIPELKTNINDLKTQLEKLNPSSEPQSANAKLQDDLPADHTQSMTSNITQ